MKEPRKQHLSEAVAGLISKIVEMMLGLLRARGLRGLLELPALFRFVRDLRRLAEEFATLFAAFKAGTRTPVAPEPALQAWQPAPARAPRTPRVAARPDPEDRARRRQAAPAADPEPDRARAEPAPSQ